MVSMEMPPLPTSPILLVTNLYAFNHIGQTSQKKKTH